MAKLTRIFDGKRYKLIAANKQSTRPFSSKTEAKKKAKFYKRHKVLKRARVVKTKGGYQVYGQ